MRFGIMNLLCLVLCTLGTFSFGELEDTSETASPQLSLVSDTLWAEQLTTFQKLLKTDAKAARAELQQVANTLFGGHRLAEEWVPLYFRISQNGTEHPSDVKRVSELEIRMLTGINFKKYSVQIHRHQEAFQRFADMEKSFQSHSHAPNPHSEKPIPTSKSKVLRLARKHAAAFEKLHGTDAEVLRLGRKHAAAFEKLRDTDAEAARAELVSLFALQYGEHPLVEKLVDTVLALAPKKRVTYPEVIELTELQLQLMKETDAQKHAEAIQTAERSLERLKNISNLLRKQGSLETETIRFHFSLEAFLPPEKE